MNRNILNALIGRRVFMILKSNHHYTGTILAVENNFIQFVDKRDEMVILDVDQIKVLKESKDFEEAKKNV
jgi:small nuclear ribonucleoprotein (snRNP)-like protein